MKGHGFYTGSFIANGYISDYFGFDQGWDTYRNYIRQGLRSPAQYVAADTLAWLDSRPTDKPFFLYVHTIDPHVPYRPPSHFLALYGDTSYRGPVDFSHDSLLLEHIKSGRLHLNDHDKAHLEALYDGEITYHDVHFARILDGLTRRGLDDDTIVVVTADHGEEFWDHGSVGHGHSVYEELIHVPLFVRIPGVTDGVTKIDTPVGLVDVLPTILDALGVPIPDEVSGRSFLNILLGQSRPAPRAVVTGFLNGWRTVVVGHLKLVQRSVHAPKLYDLSTDPREEHDLAPSRPLAVRYLRGLLGLQLAKAEPVGDGTGAAPVAAHRVRAHHHAETTQIDPQTAAQLRALGYVSGRD